jgi:Fur family ferric uptake transcriptional regulator
MKNKNYVSVEQPLYNNWVITDCDCLASISLVKIKHITKNHTSINNMIILSWQIQEKWLNFVIRVQSIKKTIEEIFDIEITNHSYIYTELKKPRRTEI